jgi:hypothetical protein
MHVMTNHPLAGIHRSGHGDDHQRRILDSEKLNGVKTRVGSTVWAGQGRSLMRLCPLSLVCAQADTREDPQCGV